MTVLPAKLAGVQKVYLVTPPNKFKSIDPHILAVANLLKVDGVYKAGGAQAIAAFAFGTKSIPRVDKIIGPGNVYVAEAKRFQEMLCVCNRVTHRIVLSAHCGVLNPLGLWLCVHMKRSSAAQIETDSRFG